jgi:acetolactate synthase-1/3 small subunit
VHHILTVLTENKPGVLARISGLFSRRGFNIHSLAVGPTEDPRFSRMTVVVDLEGITLEQVIKQLNKLVNVIKITELSPTAAVERELLLVTVSTEGGRSPILELAAIFEAEIVDVGFEALTLMLAGEPDQLDALEELVRPYGILELQRTGRIALPRLSRESTKLRSVKRRPASA